MFNIVTGTAALVAAGAAAGVDVLLAGVAAAGALAELVVFELELLLPQPATSAPPSARQAATE
jgi:hypothetical protein